MSQLLSIHEIARLLAVSCKTVRRYVTSGDLEAVRLGRRQFRISQEALARFLQKNATSNEANS